MQHYLPFIRYFLQESGQPVDGELLTIIQRSCTVEPAKDLMLSGCPHKHVQICCAAQYWLKGQFQTPGVIKHLPCGPIICPAFGHWLCEGDLTGNIVVGGDTVNTAVTGNYVITYNVSDSAANPASEIARTVRVQDSTPPEITLAGDNPMYLYIGDTFTEPGYSASDACDPTVSTGVVVGGDTVDTSIAGTYAVTYYVEDTSGNSFMITRNVIVQETMLPVAIDSIATLQLIGNDPGYPLNGNYYLTGDLDASDTLNWNGGFGFQPVGSSSPVKATTAFTGTFDGQGHTISGLFINRPTEPNVCLLYTSPSPRDRTRSRMPSSA